MKVEDRLDGATNFISWKPRALLMLKENDILNFVNEKGPEPEVKEDKSQWRKNDDRARRLLVDSVKDHLVPQFYKRRQLGRCSKPKEAI